MARQTQNGTGYYNPMAEQSQRTSPKRRSFLEDPSSSSTSSPLFDHTKVKWLTPTHSYNRHNSIAEEERLRAANRQNRSLSADVCLFRKDSLSRWNERYINFTDHSRLISYRWMPETGISMSRYIPSPLARRTSDGDRPKFCTHGETLMPAGTRWMTYGRNPSPCSLPRIPSDREKREKPEPTESSQSSPARKDLEVKREVPLIKREEPPSPPPPPPPPPPQIITTERRNPPAKRVEIPDWQSVRKKPGRFPERTDSPGPRSQSQKESHQTPSKFPQTTSLDDTRLKQRLQELYDIKTEAEWPLPARKASRESLAWTRSSEEDKSSFLQSDKSKNSRQPEIQSTETRRQSSTDQIHRRNSQDLEFNNRTQAPSQQQPPQPSLPVTTTVTTAANQANHISSRPSESSTRRPSLPRPQSRKSFSQTNRMHQTRLAYSEEAATRPQDEEDDGSVTKVGDVTFAKVKRIKDKRSFSDDYENPNRRKIIVDAPTSARSQKNAEEFAISFPESSSASQYNPLVSKRGSVEFRSPTKKVEMPHRRTMSQYEPRSRASVRFLAVRPRTPMPPPEINPSGSPRKDFIVPEKTGGIPPRQRRNSTRYKVYLT